eukprot:6529902-Prymnesium_polylepis.1
MPGFVGIVRIDGDRRPIVVRLKFKATHRLSDVRRMHGRVDAGRAQRDWAESCPKLPLCTRATSAALSARPRTTASFPVVWVRRP